MRTIGAFRVAVLVLALVPLAGCESLKEAFRSGVEDVKAHFEQTERIERKVDALLEHHGVEVSEETEGEQ